METRSAGEFRVGRAECLEKLNGGLELHNTYHQFGGDGFDHMAPEAKAYYDDRAARIAVGEDVWMARDMASDLQRTFDYFSGGVRIGSLTIDSENNEIKSRSLNNDVQFHNDNLVEAVDSIEGQLSRVG